MNPAQWLPGGRSHLDERLIMAAADGRGSMAAWSAGQRTHLLRCEPCRSLLARHEELAAALGGEWGLREVPGVSRASYRAPMRRARQVLASLAAVALVAVLAGSWWAWRSSPFAAQPSPSFAVYAVNPDGTFAYLNTCVMPAQNYGQGQPDWGEDYLIGARLYLNFTGQPEAHVAALRALLPADCAVYVRIVPVSSAVGRALQERISDDAASLQAAGVQLTTVGFDPIADKVTVSVYPLTPQARAELERRYPRRCWR